MLAEIKMESSFFEYNTIANNIKKQINNIFGLNISVYFFNKNMIFKTTSGKVCRQKCKKNYCNMECLYYLD